MRPRNEGRSIHVGLNQVDQDVFLGLLPDLGAAERDAQAMRSWASDAGCSTRMIGGNDATRVNVITTIRATIDRLIPGDLLLLSFAGHGVSLRGVATDPDGWDEGWCLHDGVLLDDEIHLLLAEVPAGCEVVVVTDACFAAGIIDAQSRAIGAQRQSELLAPLRLRSSRSEVVRANISIGYEDLKNLPTPAAVVDLTSRDVEVSRRDLLSRIGKLAPRAPISQIADDAIAEMVMRGVIPPGPMLRTGPPRNINAEVVALSAAAEGQLAYEGPSHGLFTAALTQVLERPLGPSYSYEDLMRIVASIVAVQTTTLSVVGASSRTVRGSPALARVSATQGHSEEDGGLAYDPVGSPPP